MQILALKLFILLDNSGAIVTDGRYPLYFTGKQDAKAVRDSLGKGYTVGYGPDHRKYAGETP